MSLVNLAWSITIGAKKGVLFRGFSTAYTIFLIISAERKLSEREVGERLFDYELGLMFLVIDTGSIIFKGGSCS